MIIQQVIHSFVHSLIHHSAHSLTSTIWMGGIAGKELRTYSKRQVNHKFQYRVIHALLIILTVLTKIHIIRAVVFPVVMYGCESWTIKKSEGQRIDAFELWCWRRLLRVPWTARRSNQSILKEINPVYSLQGLMLKLQYFGNLMQRADS